MNKVVFFSPYFGLLPPFTKVIFQSWGHNKNCDFIIHTDNEKACLECGVQNYPNIRLIKMNYNDFLSLFEDRLSLNMEQLKKETGQLLCRLKPTFGECFSELINQYAWWGYIDIDVLLGETKTFLTDERLNGYDILPFTQIIRGNTILLKNIDKINVLWRSVSDYYKLLEEASCSFHFDEDDLYFPKAIQENKDIKVYQHTKDTNWTVDFRWHIYPNFRYLFWKESISEIIYHNHRIYDKFHEQEFAAVVLDSLSKWTEYFGFPDSYRQDSQYVCFFNPKYPSNKYSLRLIKNPVVFYKTYLSHQRHKIGKGISFRTYSMVLKIKILLREIKVLLKSVYKNIKKK